MKKKIKDLTIGETVKICNNAKDCYLCPLYRKSVCPYATTENMLEQEVEVDE